MTALSHACPLRVVIVGHGPVGARLADDLVRLCPPGTVDLAVLGAEPHGPYNRLLLGEVVAGRARADRIALPVPDAGARIHRGVAATAIDRAARTVHDDAGRTHPYDVLVLATGAQARMPRLAGLDPDRPGPNVVPLRTLDDCAAIARRATPGRSAVVLGGGVLGVEAAAAIAERGCAVTLVHRGPHLMDRQLDPTTGVLLGRRLGDLGMDVRVGVAPAAVERVGAEVAAVTEVTEVTEVAEVRLDDGTRLAVDLVVVAAGVVPDTALAAAAGLAVRTGIVVDAESRTDDPAIHAIGDCSEPPWGNHGLVAAGWHQADRLAAVVAAHVTLATLPDPEPPPGADVVRLKMPDTSLVAMGRMPDELAEEGPRVVTLADARGRRSVRVAVADGRVVAATCLGDPAVAADLVVAFERRLPAPADPAALLRRGAGATLTQERTPALLPARSVVCRCNGVTKADIVAARMAGADTVDDVACRTRATTGCGTCRDTVTGILEWLDEVDPQQVDPQQVAGATEAAPRRVAEPVSP